MVWGCIVAWIDSETGAPMQQEFYDEDGVKLRLMSFSDVREQNGRHFPHRWKMVPLDKEGHETRIVIDAVVFDADIPDSVFTKRQLQRVQR